MRPPHEYDQYPLKTISGGIDTLKSNQSFAKVSNVFTNNIAEMISPEMLSAEETVNLMVEVLRRANQSQKLATMLGNCEEFKTLTKGIKRYVDDGENHMDGNSTMSGRVKKQKSFIDGKSGTMRSFLEQ